MSSATGTQEQLKPAQVKTTTTATSATGRSHNTDPPRQTQFSHSHSAIIPQHTTQQVNQDMIPHYILEKIQPNTIQQDIELMSYIRQANMPNAHGVQVPVSSNWNIQLLSQLVTSKSDREVMTYLTYGWPVSFDSNHTQL